jgi:hypothetical protein
MSRAPTVHRTSDLAPIDGAVCLTRPGRTHTGIAVHIDGEVKWLHLADHLQLLVDPLPTTSWWVQPALGRHQRNAVVVGARRVCQRRREGKVAFGFDGQIGFDEEGRAVTAGTGVTCASFVARLFEHFGAPLVHLDSWADRTAARAKADRKVLFDLAEFVSKRDPPQGRLLREAVDSPRVRPEEVAAASGAKNRPVEFKDAEPMGQTVMDCLV